MARRPRARRTRLRRGRTQWASLSCSQVASSCSRSARVQARATSPPRARGRTSTWIPLRRALSPLRRAQAATRPPSSRPSSS
eukprot:14040669-Alexandrium_andersonii.AAC.1